MTESKKHSGLRVAVGELVSTCSAGVMGHVPWAPWAVVLLGVGAAVSPLLMATARSGEPPNQQTPPAGVPRLRPFVDRDYRVAPNASNSLPNVLIAYQAESNLRTPPPPTPDLRFLYVPPFSFVRDANGAIASADGSTVGFTLLTHLESAPAILRREVEQLIAKQGLHENQFAPVSPTFFRVAGRDATGNEFVFYEFPSKPLVGGDHTFEFPTEPLPCTAAAPSPEAAKAFADRLNKGRISITIELGFAGFGFEENNAVITFDDMQRSNTYKQLFGPGGPRSVSRKQIARIAREACLGRNITVSTEYDDSDFAALLTKLVEKMAKTEVKLDKRWESLDQQFVNFGWDPNDFKADLITRSRMAANSDLHTRFTEDLEREARREGGGFSIGLFGARILDVATPGTDYDRFKKSITRDVAMKWGIQVEEEGQRFVPRTISVYSNDDLTWRAMGSYVVRTERRRIGGATKTFLVSSNNTVDASHGPTVAAQLGRQAEDIHRLAQDIRRVEAVAENVRRQLERQLGGAIQFKELELKYVELKNVRTAWHDTGFSAKEWEVGIVGFTVEGGDVRINFRPSLFVWSQVAANGNWEVLADFNHAVQNKNWRVKVVAIRRGLLTR